MRRMLSCLIIQIKISKVSLKISFRYHNLKEISLLYRITMLVDTYPLCFPERFSVGHHSRWHTRFPGEVRHSRTCSNEERHGEEVQGEC